MGLTNERTTPRTVAVLRIFTLLWAFLYGSQKMFAESHEKMWYQPGERNNKHLQKRCETTSHDSKNETLNIGRKEGGQAFRLDQSLSCIRLCHPMNRSTPGLPVQHQLPEFTETHVHQVSDAIQPSHPLSSPSPLAPNPSQHQSRFQ